MIYDYAIDPDAISLHSQLRYLYENLGFENGRLSARHPEKREWLRSIKENISTDPAVNSKELEVIINHLFKYSFSEKILAIDTGKSWIANSIELLSTGEIKGIITDTQGYINPSQLSKLVEEWNVPKDVLITRSYSAFNGIIKPIVERSRRIKIIDPYFDITEERFYKFLRLCLQSSSNSWSSRIEIHVDYRDCRSYGTTDFETSWKNFRSQEVGSRNNVEIYILVWQEILGKETIHDRYLVTENGGVRIPRGTDIVGIHDTADISLLSNEVAENIYLSYQFSGNSTKYKLISKHKI